MPYKGTLTEQSKYFPLLVVNGTPDLVQRRRTEILYSPGAYSYTSNERFTDPPVSVGFGCRDELTASILISIANSPSIV